MPIYVQGSHNSTLFLDAEVKLQSFFLRHNPKNINESLILFGDVGGGISCIKFNKASKRLFDANIGKISVLSNSMMYKYIPSRHYECVLSVKLQHVLNFKYHMVLQKLILGAAITAIYDCGALKDSIANSLLFNAHSI